MTPLEAARLLDLPADASSDQIEARFLEVRAKLEDKIAKAPTPGLKEKYRATLAQLTDAFETLTLAADSSSLPVLERLETSAAPAPAVPPAPSTSPTPPAPSRAPASSPKPAPRARAGHNLEFILVAVLAVALLGVGGWWVMKTRAEQAERTRIEAEAKAEAERQAELARLAAERARQEEEARKIAERERLDRLTAALRSQLAEARIAWEAIEKEERQTERALAEVKSDLRNGGSAELRDRAAALQRYLGWLTEHLEKHPAKIERAKVEELLNARLPDDAAAPMKALQGILAALERELPEKKRAMLALDGSLEIDSTPKGLAFELTDAWGRRRIGTTPATLAGLAPGSASVTFRRDGFRSETTSALVSTGKTARTAATLVSQSISLKAESDVNFWVEGKWVGRGTVTLADLAPKTYKLQVGPANRPAYPTTFEIQQQAGALSRTFDYAALAREDRTCSPCSGQGSFNRSETCRSCRGRGSVNCQKCGGEGHHWVNVNNQNVKWPCFSCSRGRVSCNSCNSRGQHSYTDTCTKCSGDGRVSQLQLALAK